MGKGGGHRRRGLMVRELQAAHDWQVEQAWSDLQAIAGGDNTFGSWDEIEQTAERARQRIHEREAAAARVAGINLSENDRSNTT